VRRWLRWRIRVADGTSGVHDGGNLFAGHLLFLNEQVGDLKNGLPVLGQELAGFLTGGAYELEDGSFLLFALSVIGKENAIAYASYLVE
jgi:hypothetical protein